MVGLGLITVLAALAYVAMDYRRVSQIFLEPAQRASAYRDDTLAKVRGSWLFEDQVHFAEVVLTPVTPENASQMYAMTRDLLHFSPEARVVEKLIDSALVLGLAQEAEFFQSRYRAVFPREYAQWADTRKPWPDPAHPARPQPDPLPINRR